MKKKEILLQVMTEAYINYIYADYHRTQKDYQKEFGYKSRAQGLCLAISIMVFPNEDTPFNEIDTFETLFYETLINSQFRGKANVDFKSVQKEIMRIYDIFKNTDAIKD